MSIDTVPDKILNKKVGIDYNKYLGGYFSI